MTDNVEPGGFVDGVGDVFAVGLEGGDNVYGCVVFGDCAAGADGAAVDHDGGTIEAAHGH